LAATGQASGLAGSDNTGSSNTGRNSTGCSTGSDSGAGRRNDGNTRSNGASAGFAALVRGSGTRRSGTCGGSPCSTDTRGGCPCSHDRNTHPARPGGNSPAGIDAGHGTASGRSDNAASAQHAPARRQAVRTGRHHWQLNAQPVDLRRDDAPQFVVLGFVVLGITETSASRSAACTYLL
jgi:hypothetical protein